MLYTSYLDFALCPIQLNDTVNQFIESSRGIKFDSIIGIGNSGALLAGAISIRTGIPIILVRKKGVRNHSLMSIEGYTEYNTSIFVDDMVSSGETLYNVSQEIQFSIKFSHMKIMGIFEAIGIRRGTTSTQNKLKKLIEDSYYWQKMQRQNKEDYDSVIKSFMFEEKTMVA